MEGPAALNRPDMIKALDLSPVQCAKLRGLQDQVRARVQEFVDATKGMSTEERQAMMPEILVKLEQMRKETTGQAIEVLTPQQRETFEKLQGTKISLDAPPPPPKAAPKEVPAEKKEVPAEKAGQIPVGFGRYIGRRTRKSGLPPFLAVWPRGILSLMRWRWLVFQLLPKGQTCHTAFRGSGVLSMRLFECG